MERAISKARGKKLRELAKLFNTFSANPPPIVKELLICLDISVTPEETDFLLMVGENKYTYEQLLLLSDMPDEGFRPFFEKMRHKGMINTIYEDNGKKSFMLYPMIPSGWFDDTYLSDGEESEEKKEFVYYFDLAVKKLENLNFFPVRPLLDLYTKKTMKTVNTIAAINPPDSGKRFVNIDQTLKAPPSEVYTTHGVNELIEKHEGSIAVKHCFCRQWRKMVDDQCDFGHPSEICIAFGDRTKKYVETGVGRAISKEEAYKIIKDSQQRGAVHTVFYMEEDLNKSEAEVCNCCWDCCGVFRMYNTGAQPLLLKAFYFAELIDDDSCSCCGECERYCPVNAIHMSDGKAQINKEKCIGCGQCQFQCPEEAIQLVFQEREVYLPIQKKSDCRL
ncbi:MAG: 4Fe-4S binding protein [Deltaproteobacteria bacterium]|nr:4Fe-4S binding protein [Deltaproteobacteria bacterium]